MKLAIGLPWYNGPNEDTFDLYFDLMMYFGALRERSLWVSRLGADLVKDLELPPLSEGVEGDKAEPTIEEWESLGEFQLGVANYARTSLVGLARECCVDMALEWDADYILFWDADMKFERAAFLELWRTQKPVVGALAFTARYPVVPVIYSVTQEKLKDGGYLVESSQPFFNYPEDSIVTNDTVDGELAFGSGVMLIDMKVFKVIPKPWFTSTGCGEDWFFCHRCAEFNVERVVNTKVKTKHKEHVARWVDEAVYKDERRQRGHEYKEVYGDVVKWEEI